MTMTMMMMTTRTATRRNWSRLEGMRRMRTRYHHRILGPLPAASQQSSNERHENQAAIPTRPAFSNYEFKDGNWNTDPVLLCQTFDTVAQESK